MTDWNERELELDLSFLDEGNYSLQIFKDGINANRFAEDYKKETLPVTKTSKVKMKLAKGGGWVGILKKE